MKLPSPISQSNVNVVSLLLLKKKQLSLQVYPDPVRVLSIGAALNELVGDPQAGYKYSVEFCGGT